jgi:hypothetical protein
MRKLFCAVLLATLSAGLLPQPALAAGADSSHKSGTLVIVDRTIYLVGTAQKRGFLSWNEFLSYNYRASRIKEANEADKLLFEGPPMRARPGTLALDTADRRTIYLIGKDSEKRGFSSAAALKKYKKKKTVIWPIDLGNYPIGPNID